MKNTHYLDALLKFQRAYFGGLLEESDGCVHEVARVSGFNRCHLYRLLERIGLGEEARPPQ